MEKDSNFQENKVREIEQTLSDVKKMMQQSTRSRLDALIPLLCGVAALTGSFLAQRDCTNMLSHAIAVLTAAVLTIFIIPVINAKRNGTPLSFNSRNRRMFVSLALPLIAGGALCIAMLTAGAYEWLASVMLLCTGLGAVNVARNMENSVQIVGYIFMLLGIIACFMRQNGLLLWTLGFGWLDLAYGLILIFRNGYGRKE